MREFHFGIEIGQAVFRNLLEESADFSRADLHIAGYHTLHPLRKPKLIKACIATVSADNMISTIELELLRTVADCLECPMPPLGTQKAA